METPVESPDGHTITESDAPAESLQRRPGRPITHGGRSRLLAALELPEQAEARAALTERVAAIIAALGGPEALSPVAIGLAERHAKLEVVADCLFDRIERFGPLTGKGYTRAALTNWLQVVDRLQRSSITLGLERKSKPVTSLVEVMSGK